MKEQSVQFSEGLHGIHIDASGAREAGNTRPVFILINAGYQHSVGPYRLYTDLARHLALSGYDSLRFDYSGIGNSCEPPFSAALDMSEQGAGSCDLMPQSHIRHIGKAMEYLSEDGNPKKFVLCGLCSGADESLQVAVSDSRVIGVIPIDSAGFRAGRYYWHHYLRHYPRRLVSLSKWRNLLKQRKLAMTLASAEMDATKTTDATKIAFSANDGYRSLLSPESFRLTVSTLISRRCKTLFVYSGGIAHYYNHKSQFIAMTGPLDFEGHIEVAYYPKADHLFFLVSHRRTLIKDITEWSDKNFVLATSSTNRWAA